MRFFNFLPKIILISVIMCCIVGNAQSQKPSKTEKALYKQAFDYLALDQYQEGIQDYIQLLKMSPKSPQYNFEIGVAYLRSPKDFYKAEKHLETALKYSAQDTIDELYYYLGKAYQNNHKFTEAKESYKDFERFIKPTKEGSELKDEVEWLEKTCNHGEYHLKLNTKNPLENKSKPINDIKKFFLNVTDYVTIQNLGTKINSIHNDGGAVFFNDEKDIFFTSNRNPLANPNKFTYGESFKQIFISKYENGEWLLPNHISYFKLFEGEFNNTSAQVSIVAVNKDETVLVLCKNGTLYETSKNDGRWTDPKMFPNNINIKKSKQPSACLSDDGKTLIVISDKKGGYGKQDMYSSKKDADGKWGELVNMGSVLNTEHDEGTPFMIGSDLLYFSSKGHSSIGGYDVFFSKYKDGKWGNPQNLGIPINTPQDEIAYIRSKKDPSMAYYASARVDGYGYKDVYRITSHFETIKRDDLPSIAISDFLADGLKKKQQEEKEAEVAVITSPVPTDPATPITPTKSSPPVVSKKEVIKPVDAGLFKDILFTFNENELTPESKEQLREIGEFMNKNPGFVIAISGHADYKGSNEINDQVSRQRALIVANRLGKAGVNLYNVIYSYFGATKPKADGKNANDSDNPDNRAKNRRVEFELSQFAVFRVIEFATNSSAIASKGNMTLKEVAEYMKANPDTKVELSGFSDSLGNKAYNKTLSEKRVSGTKKALLNLGVNANSISTNFYGEEKPSTPITNARRVEIRVK